MKKRNYFERIFVLIVIEVNFVLEISVLDFLGSFVSIITRTGSDFIKKSFFFRKLVCEFLGF